MELKETVSEDDIQTALTTLYNANVADAHSDDASDKNFEKFLRSFEKECEYREKEIMHKKELEEFKEKIEFENHKNLTTAILRQVDVFRDDINEYEENYKKTVDRISNRISDDLKEKLSKRRSNAMACFYSWKRINYQAVIRREW